MKSGMDYDVGCQAIISLNSGSAVTLNVTTVIQLSVILYMQGVLVELE